MYKTLVALLLSAHVCVAYTPSPDWKLKKEEEGIKIFMASNGTAYKALKVELTVDATINQLIAYMTDIEKQPEWVYNTRTSRLLQTIRPNELVFYSEVSLPWPCSDRDYVAHIQIEQPSPGLTTIDSRAEPGYLPAKKGFVRVNNSVTHWEIRTIGEHEQKIVYTLNFDLGGSVPPWLVNMFLAKGPSHTFKALREGVKQPKYADAHVAFLKHSTM